MPKNSSLCFVLLLAGGACASSQAEQVRDARNEQTDARTVAQTRAIEDREEARIDAIDREHERADARAERMDGRREDAAKELLEVRKDRATYEAKAQARIDTIGVRINAARDKLNTIGAKAPIGFGTELTAVSKEHNNLRLEVSQLSSTPAAKWEDTTERVAERLDNLNARVKKLTQDIEDQDI